MNRSTLIDYLIIIALLIWIVSAIQPDRLRRFIDYINCTVDGSCGASDSLKLESTESKDFSNKDAAENTLKAMTKNSNKLVIAYSFEAGPFSYNGKDKDNPDFTGNGSQVFGIEVEMVKEFVKNILGGLSDEDAHNIIEWRSISTSERIHKAKESDIDLVIGAISYEADRCDSTRGVICTKQYHWIDSQALLTAASPDNDNIQFENICSDNDDGKAISVLPNTTAKEFIGPMNIFVSLTSSVCANRELEEEVSRSAALDLVISGRRIAHKSDAEILKFYEEYYKPSELQIVGEGKIDLEEKYVLLTKASNEGLIQLLSKEITDMIDNCQLQKWAEEYDIESKIPAGDCEDA